jgi:hypothetical protein
VGRHSDPASVVGDNVKKIYAGGCLTGGALGRLLEVFSFGHVWREGKISNALVKFFFR